MSDLHKLKARSARLKQLKETSHLREVPVNVENNRHLVGGVDEDTLYLLICLESIHNVFAILTHQLQEEVSFLLNSIDDGTDPMDHILEPVFLSLFDGTMRAFKIGTKQGITASRLYSECKSFSYDNPSNSGLMLDSYTEFLNEEET